MANKILVFDKLAFDPATLQYFQVILIDGGTSYNMYVKDVSAPVNPGLASQISASGAIPVIAPSGAGDVVGLGTTGTVPLWTDGPNSVIGDSVLTQVAGSLVQPTGSLTVTLGQFNLPLLGLTGFSNTVQSLAFGIATNNNLRMVDISALVPPRYFGLFSQMGGDPVWSIIDQGANTRFNLARTTDPGGGPVGIACNNAGANGGFIIDTVAALDGYIKLTNDLGTTFTALVFGLATVNWPMWKVSGGGAPGAGFQARAADDSGLAPIDALSVTVTSAVVTPIVRSAAGVALALNATAPVATIGASQAGKAVSVTASAAVASTDTAGAAAGGAVTITAGAAARNASGNANGGDISLITGAGIGTGTTGQIFVNAGTALIPTIAQTGGGNPGISGLSWISGVLTTVHNGVIISSFDQNQGLATKSNLQIGWSSGVPTVNANDTALSRISAGLIGVGTGAAGSFAGSLKLTDIVQVGKITTYNNIAVTGLPVIRATGQFDAQVAAVATVATYTPAVDTTLDVTCSILVTTSGTENFTIQVAYTDTGNTARVAVLPLRLLTGVNVIIVNFANGAIPYAGVLERIRVKGGTAVTISTTGTFTGCTYNVGGDIREGS